MKNPLYKNIVLLILPLCLTFSCTSNDDSRSNMVITGTTKNPDSKGVFHFSYGQATGVFAVYTINDKKGDIKKEAVFNTLDVKGAKLEHFDTDKILSLSDSEILSEGFEGRNKDFLVKVSAKK